jgi:LuxR family maltose regulon positive regulatory protein
VATLSDWESRRVGGLHCDAPMLFPVRVWIESGRWDDALRILDLLWPHAVSTCRLVVQIDVLVRRAYAEAQRGRPDAAVVSMRDALNLASPGRYVRPFIDLGPAVAPIVERAVPLCANRDFAMLILSSFETAPRPAASAPELLSERELEVLRIIAAGASNQEAGRKLFIAPSTVKKHLENIYAKLDVGGRTEAIARAREMGVL